MTKAELEYRLLEDIASNLRAEGYDVFVRPQKGILPAFMEGATPDAVAFGRPKNLAIMVVDSGSVRARIDHLSSLLKGARDWELRVFPIKSSAGEEEMDTTPLSAILSSIATVKQLAASGCSGPALLLAWATFESFARNRERTRFARPQTPGRLIEMLASDGRVAPSEADVLRRLASVRNRLVHGDLEVGISATDLQTFIEVLENLTAQESVAAE